MNKSELVESVAGKLEFLESRAQAQRVIEAVFESVGEGVRGDGRVAVAGFGTFERRHRAARKGRNPSTKEPMEIPASTTVGFKPSQALKDAMEGVPAGAH